MYLMVRYVYFPQYVENEYREYAHDENDMPISGSSAYIGTSVIENGNFKEILEGLKLMMDEEIPLNFTGVDKSPGCEIDTGEQYFYRIADISVNVRPLDSNFNNEDPFPVIVVRVKEDY